MSTFHPPQEQANLPVAKDEAAMDATPFGLRWLQAVDPFTFSPRTWEGGNGHVRIFLSPPEGQPGGARIERYIARYLDGTRGVKDEVHFPGEFDRVSQLRYEFNDQGELTDYPVDAPSEHLDTLVAEMSGLVHMPGSSISATSVEFGLESNFVSDGTQWVDQRTAAPMAPRAFAAVARLAVEAPRE